MDLLPKTHQEFSSAEYWNSFFKKRGKESFEWYGEYAELSGILHKYIKTKDNTLVIGCGSSRLSEDLYDLGYHSLVNIDISDVVIKQMKDRNKTKRPGMIYEKMDVFKMSYDDGQYSVVLDKGTLDALLPDYSHVPEITAMFEEIGRVLRVGGRYICISLAQKHIVDTILEYFVERRWMSRVHCLLKERSRCDEDDFPLPVVVFIFTKFKSIPGASPILEFSMGEDGKVRRYNSVTELSTMIEETQNYSLIRHNLHKRLQPDDQMHLDLHSPETSTPRYTLTIVDRIKQRASKFAIFIVPQGREVEWTFSTDPGRIQLADSAGFQRLVVVCLHRGQSYSSLASIQDELSEKVLELAPYDLEANVKVPFLSIGEDIGTRTVRYEGDSEVSGRFVVEDVDLGDDVLYRRLIFLSNKHLIQSEVQLKKVTHKSKKKKKDTKTQTELVIDDSALSMEFHVGFISGLAMIDDIMKKIKSELRVLIIGLGGGNLPMFLRKYFKQVHIDVVELDGAMVTVAKEWFGFHTDDCLRVFEDDGINFIEEKSKQETGPGNIRYDAVMFDVDNKDTSSGMTSPPEGFVQPGFLNKVKDILDQSGLLILNLACRNKEKRKEVLENIHNCFGLICSVQNEEDVNEIIYANCRVPAVQESKSTLENYRTKASELTKLTEINRHGDSLDLSDYLQELQII